MAGRSALGRRVGSAPVAARVDDDAGAALGIGPRRPHGRGCCVGRRHRVLDGNRYTRVNHMAED